MVAVVDSGKSDVFLLTHTLPRLVSVREMCQLWCHHTKLAEMVAVQQGVA